MNLNNWCKSPDQGTEVIHPICSPDIILFCPACQQNICARDRTSGPDVLGPEPAGWMGCVPQLGGELC